MGSPTSFDVTNPEDGATIAHDQVTQVAPVDKDLLLFVRMIDIVSIGGNGIHWRSARLAVDDLRVEQASMEMHRLLMRLARD